MKTLRNFVQRCADRPETVIQLTINTGIFAIFLITLGAIWDTLVHIQSHHTTFAPAHMLVMGTAMAFMFCFCVAAAILRMRNDIDPKDRRALWIVSCGSGIVLFSLIVFDELIWHTLLGRGIEGDQSAWSPPHLLFLMGMIIAMYGIALVAKRRVEKNFLAKVQLFLSVSAMYFVGLVLFLEYDAPDGMSILHDRPGWFYPIVATAWLVFTTLIAVSFFRRPVVLIFATTLAWGFWSGVVTVVETLSGVDFLFFPYPIMIPAFGITLAAWLFARRSSRLAGRCFAAVFGAAVCYWGIVAWAVWVTELPQQITGQSSDWMRWFVVYMLPAALLVGTVSHLMTNFLAKAER